MWAVVIGWILSVSFHEFAHGLIAHFGGDYTVRERGGLTLNPLQYIDPFGSIVLPVIFLLMGGVPLPGGVTYIREDLLRSNAWRTAVSLAGPASNLLLFVVLLGVLHPAVGLFDITKPHAQWTNAEVFIGAMAALQVFAFVLNLIPCPPLDGFNAIAPYLPPDFVTKVRTPPINLLCLLAFVFVVAALPVVQNTIARVMIHTPPLLGMPRDTGINLYRSMQTALFGG